MNTNAVLYPEVIRADVEQAISDLGLKLHQVWEKDDAGGSYEQVWTNSEQSVAVNYIESALLNLSYLVIRGKKSYDLFEKLENKLRIFSAEEIIEKAYEGRTQNEQVRCLSRLTAMFPQFDKKAFDVFQALATQHQSILLQQAAINALGYNSWPQCLDLLEDIELNDPSNIVRERAKLTLCHIRSNIGSDQFRK